MAAVFSANMPELKTDDGKTVPDSTAKFVLLALADHASDDGENAYIGVKRICQKTNFSTSTVCNALNALRHNGFITLVGKSKSETNNYTINADRLQPLKFQPPKSSDSSDWNPGVSATEVKPSFKPSFKPSINHSHEGKPDLVDGVIALSQSPGIKAEARRNAILSYLGETFRINTETKAWREFSKYADGEFQTKGWDIRVFIKWLRSQNGFELQYWPPKRMMEFYPQAFIAQPSTSEDRSSILRTL